MDNQHDCEDPSGKSNIESREKPSAPLLKSTHSPKTETQEVASTPSKHVNRDEILREQKDFNNLKRYMRRESTSSKIHRWLCCIITFVFIVCVVILIVRVNIIPAVFHVTSPATYSVNTMAVHGMNVTSSPLISPAFDVTLESHHHKSKIGVHYYTKSSSVELHHSDLSLCNGVISRIREKSNNTVLLFDIALKCEEVLLSSADRMAMGNEEEQKKVGFGLKMKTHVKLVFGSIKTWKISLKVKCVATLNGLSFNSNITSQNCNSRLSLS